MAVSDLNSIISSSACRGAFQLSDGELTSLSGGDASAIDDARRTKDLWSSLASFVPDLGTVVAKRESGISIASMRGGIILEVSAPVNIGIVRAALRNESKISFEDDGKTPLVADGAKALWTLASWIDGIETRRALRVSVGTDVFRLWARKGKFGLKSDKTPADLAGFVLSANETAGPVTLSYDVSDDDAPDAVHLPLDLLATGETEKDEWHFDNLGVPKMRPRHACLKTAGRMLSLHAQLKSWGAGQPFEVTILRDGGPPEVIVEGSDPSLTRILLDGHVGPGQGLHTKEIPSNV